MEMAEPTVSLREVTDKKSLRRFIFLPRELYRAFTNWVPPIYSDEWKFHDPGQNSAFGYSEAVRTLAYRNGKAVGRIMGIINRKYNEEHQEKRARFFLLDCIDDRAVSHALIAAIEQWARRKGMEKLIGPFGFSDKDPQGLQIEGFEHLPVIAAPTNPPYLPALVEEEGYAKDVDCVSYKIPVPREMPALYEKVQRRLLRNGKMELLEFKSKREIKPYIVPLLRLVNDTFTPLYGFVPMTEEEMKRLAAQYLPVVDPDFLKVIATRTGEIHGFVLGLPDMSRGFQKAKGSLFPFGFLHILAAARKTRQLNLVLGATRRGSRGLGVEIVVGKALLESARARGFQFLDSHLVQESNALMRAECEKNGGQLYKRFRVYQKRLL